MQNTLWANRKLRFIATLECNINCFYCHNEGQPKIHSYFSEELFERVLKLVAIGENNLEAITFTGGEPLMHPQLESFIKRLSLFSPQRTVVTNGWLLNESRLIILLDSGVTKIRLGVDSLHKEKSRPTPENGPNQPIQETIKMILDQKNIELELNVVLTKFNEDEIVDIVNFCIKFGLSLKFFEHVEVIKFGNKNQMGKMEAKAIVPFEEFHLTITSAFKDVHFTHASKFGEANYLYEGRGISFRYCHYLHPYGLCYLTGTRIAPDGFVYVCMNQRGQYQIDTKEPLEKSIETIQMAVNEGCLR